MINKTSATPPVMNKEQIIRYRYASEKIENIVFYLPFAYLYRVRLGTPAKLLSWLLIYIFPTLFYSASLWLQWYNPTVSSDVMSPWVFVANYVLILVAAFGIYECGYIYNDGLSILHEQSPSLRLYEHNLQYLYMHLPHIAVVRGLIIASSLIGLYLINDGSVAVVCTIGAILTVALLFAAYNSWRTKWNVLLYPFLVFSRYIVFLIPYFSPLGEGFTRYDLLTAALLFLSFPMLNAIERFSMPRHRFRFIVRLIPDEQSKTLFRVYYYAAAAVIVAILLWLCFDLQTSVFLTAPFIVLGFERLLIYAVTFHHTPKNYLQG